ncbi:MAG: GNAT family N-acetyltransferase [Gammaproteobacteria bacterium]|nr:GNAT family N-acetyltransferase [Gammaproteobacteria bacterium]
MQVEKMIESDRNGWQQLYRGYADFYQVPMDQATLDTVWSWIIDDNENFDAIVIKDDDGKLLGFMHYRQMPSPLRGVLVGFLDDLYVHPDVRGSGAVQALFRELKIIAKDRNWPFVRWITATDNYRARSVYDRISSTIDFVTYQMLTK